MGSSRLPGKALKRAGRRTLLEHVVNRVSSSSRYDEIIIATTREPADDDIVSAAKPLGVSVVRGSTEDVLDRYVEAATTVAAEVIVRVTGDCPLLDPREVDRLVALFLSSQNTDEPLDYVTNQAGPNRRIPIGHDVEVFSMNALMLAHKESTRHGDREHVTPYLYRVPGRFRTLVSDPLGPDRGHLRLTVDTPEDLSLVTAIMEAVGDEASPEEIAQFLDLHPELLAINAHVRQKGYDSDGEARRKRIAGRVLFGRADGNPTMGFGHVSRLSSLLLAWAELGGKAALVGSGIAGIFKERLDRAGVEVFDRESTSATELIGIAHSLGVCAFAVDGYGFGESYLNALSKEATVLSIDDLAEFANPADVIVNQILGFDRARYQIKPGAKLLVGSSYVLLRPEFRSISATSDTKRTKLIVTFGGSDPSGLTLPVTKALLERCSTTLTRQGLEVVVLAGGGIDHERRAKLEEFAEKHQGLTVVFDTGDVAELFRQSLIAVTAAGTTTWELIASGVVPICIVIADNQLAVVADIVKEGAGVDLGRNVNLDMARLKEAVDGLLNDDTRRETMRRRGKTLIDGRGVWRSIDALLDALEERSTQGEEEL